MTETADSWQMTGDKKRYQICDLFIQCNEEFPLPVETSAHGRVMHCCTGLGDIDGNIVEFLFEFN